MSKVAFRGILAAWIIAMAGSYVFLLSLRATPAIEIPVREYVVAIVFVSSVILADHYPVHLRRGTKSSLINLPIFLSTVILSAPLAIAVAAIGVLAAHLIARVERGLFRRDIATATGQWMLTVYLGSQVVHLDQFGLQVHLVRLELLLLYALSFVIINFTLFSFLQACIYGEPIVTILKSTLKQGFFIEAIQYLIAIPGILAADEDMRSLILLIVPISIAYVAFKRIKETGFETVRILNDMADTVDLRDTYTGGHSKHVAKLVHETLMQLKVSGQESTLIEIAARLHDIGKVGIPDAILLKPGKLSTEEMAIMQTHSQKGAELISRYKDFSRCAAMIMHHHERWDGHGYPAGLKGHEIPFGARLIAVADSFEAMTSDRPYRQAFSVDQAIQILLAGRGEQWDPVIVNAFVDLVMIGLGEKSTGDLSSLQAASAPPQPILSSSQRSLGVES
jgi:HD-GYP domain-containing protein (c-di-GMP phosphodiesterase class II)